MKKKYIDLSGHRFGAWTALAETRHNGSVAWRCRCQCGAERSIPQYKLISGHSLSCGCVGRRTHGMTKTSTFTTWSGMIQRCTDQNNKSFSNYGGRGIEVYERWKTFSNFLEDMGVKPNGLTLDRINNDGNYQPGNCRWATVAEQNRNKRQGTPITFNGKTMIIAEWERELGFAKTSLWRRIKSGWTIERTLTTPKALKTIEEMR